MSPSKISKRTFLDRDAFMSDSRNVWTAESRLRRALEALFDVGRHILTAEQKALLSILAGYRNRLVHFYHEISADELHQICAEQLGDITAMQDALRAWYDRRQELVDPAL